MLVRIPIQEWDILGGNLDKTRSHFCEPPGEETAEAEPAKGLAFIVAIASEGRAGNLARVHIRRKIFGKGFLRLEREIEGLGCGGTKQKMSVIQGTQERFLLIIASMLADGA